MRIGAVKELQELRGKIYRAAKSNKRKRFWGLYTHVTKEAVLMQAYREAKKNRGSAGVDGQTFEDIERKGVEIFIAQISKELKDGTYKPERNLKTDIKKENGKLRTLGIPTIRDRVVQGAIKLIIEPIFETDFSDHSYGYRPNRSQHQAIARVSQGIMRRFTKIIDVDLSAYFDNVDHNILMKMVKRRINDDQLAGLIGKILRVTGQKGVPQGGVISPLLSNIYLTRIDKMFERAIRETTHKGYEQLEYCRFADDMVILVNGHPALSWLVEKSLRRLKAELEKLKVSVNSEKTKIVDVNQDETFDFLGFTFRKTSTQEGKAMVLMTPRKKKVDNLISNVRDYIKQRPGLKIRELIKGLNPILRGWLNYYRVGHSSRTFSKIRNWVEKKVRRYVRKSQGRKGFGWKEWSKKVVYDEWGLYNDYQIRYINQKALPAQ